MCGLASMKSWKGCVFFKKLIVRKIFIAYERDWLVSLVQHFKTDEPVICYQCFYGVVHYQLTYQRPVWFQRWTYSCWPVLISMSCIVCLHWNGRVWLNSYLQSGCAFKNFFFFSFLSGLMCTSSLMSHMSLHSKSNRVVQLCGEAGVVPCVNN